MGLFDFLKKKRPKMIIEMVGYKNGETVDLVSNTSTETGELWDISIAPLLNTAIKPLENSMVEYALAAKNSKRIVKRKEALESVVKTFYDIKARCAALGPEYEKYFSIMWEHLHNSENPDFSYVEKFEIELKELQDNYAQLKEQDDLYEKESEN